MSTTTSELPIAHLEEAQHPTDTADVLEKQPTSSSQYGEAPDGGQRAWLVAAGASCITFAALGYSTCFGVYQEYYTTHQLSSSSPDKIAWIGSVSSFLQFFMGALAGPAFDRFGAWIIRPAAILYVLSIMMTSLCHSYYQFMLAQGILGGLCMGSLLLPSMAAVSQYFDKKRATALGIAVSGSSVGGIVIPIALSKMLTKSSIGFGWSVRIIGFVVMPLLAFSCFAIKARLPPRPATLFIGAAWKQANFILMTVSLFFMYLGLFTPIFYLPTYAVSRGMGVTLASYLLAIMNAASTFGRIIPGILADKLGKLNMMAAAGIINGVVIFCFNKAESNAALIVYSIVFGFTSGMVISGASAAFTLCVKDQRNFGTYMGMGMAVASVAALIGPPVNGRMVKVYGGFWESSAFSGVMCLVGGLVAFAAKGTFVEGYLGKV